MLPKSRKNARELTNKGVKPQAIWAERQTRKLSKDLSWLALRSGASNEAVRERETAQASVLTLNLGPTVDNRSLWFVDGVGHGVAHRAVRRNIY
jgi:hypothetical protein